MAGTMVRVALDLRDRFGNVTASRDDAALAVEAAGTRAVAFEEREGNTFQCVLSRVACGLSSMFWQL